MEKHIQKAATVLASMRPNITTEDRKEALKELGVSPFTVSQYLNGKGRDLTTAEKLIVFFRSAITRREKVFLDNDLPESKRSKTADPAKISEHTLSPQELNKIKVIRQADAFYRESRWTSINRKEGDVLTMWNCYKTYTILIVAEGEATKHSHDIRYDLVVDTFDAIYNFFEEKRKEYFKWVKEHGNDREKKALVY